MTATSKESETMGKQKNEMQRIHRKKRAKRKAKERLVRDAVAKKKKGA
jgi:hypothetical protein